VKGHLAPALCLPFQLELQGMPLAQKEAIDHLFGGFSARRSGLAWNVTYLAAEPLYCAAPCSFVLTYRKRLLFTHCTRYPPFCGAEP
jgi:hypothetical protein